jgi:hypothetical protein
MKNKLYITTLDNNHKFKTIFDNTKIIPYVVAQNEYEHLYESSAPLIMLQVYYHALNVNNTNLMLKTLEFDSDSAFVICVIGTKISEYDSLKFPHYLGAWETREQAVNKALEICKNEFNKTLQESDLLIGEIELLKPESFYN